MSGAVVPSDGVTAPSRSCVTEERIKGLAPKTAAKGREAL